MSQGFLVTGVASSGVHSDMITASEAIVLKSMKQGETSKILTLYTRAYGKLNVIAKGAREMKSKFGGALEVFTHVNALFYKGPQPGLYLLSKADVVRSNAKLIQSLDRIEAAMSVVELIVRAMHDEEQNEQLFDLISETLDAMSHAESDDAVDVLLVRFYLHFAKASGFELKLREDHVERGPAPGDYDKQRVLDTYWVFNLSTGKIIETIAPCSQFAGIERAGERVISGEIRAALLYLEESPVQKATALRLSPSALNSLLDLFRAYFAQHIPTVSLRSLKSARVFGRM